MADSFAGSKYGSAEGLELLEARALAAGQEEAAERKRSRLVGGGIVFVAVLLLGGASLTVPKVVGKTAMQNLADSIRSKSKGDEECLATDDIYIYKYTIASAAAVEDGEWADDMFGCSFRDVTASHGCAKLGKTTCFSQSLSYNLHFVVNEQTEAGPFTVGKWDKYFRDLHGDLQTFDAFMDFRLVFYVPDLNKLVNYLQENDIAFMVRKTPDAVSKLGLEKWFSVLVMSPSGNIFEYISTELEGKSLDKETFVEGLDSIASWSDDDGKDECPRLQEMSPVYNSSTLNRWHTYFSEQQAGRATNIGLPYALPVRNQIAVEDVDRVVDWYKYFMPATDIQYMDHNTDDCAGAHFHLKSYTVPDYSVETRFVLNSKAKVEEHSIADFITYVNEINKEWTAPDYGWTGWYDRHLGIMLDTCSLDKYMTRFAKKDISFNPHGRNGTTINTDTKTNHVWTEGVQGWGLEMQGFFDYTYKSCYTVFDWCTWDTNGDELCDGKVITTADKKAAATTTAN